MSLNSLFIAVTLVTLALPIEAKAQDNGNCSNATLHGSYGLHATGEIISVGDFAAVGRFTFDGKGKLTGTLFVRVNGNNNTLTLTGTYSVSSDCTVSDVWNLSDGSTSTHESVIVEQGKGYFILNNTQGDPSVISGEAKKQ
jgi:hypothetical protein